MPDTSPSKGTSPPYSMLTNVGLTGYVVDNTPGFVSVLPSEDILCCEVHRYDVLPIRSTRVIRIFRVSKLPQVQNSTCRV